MSFIWLFGSLLCSPAVQNSGQGGRFQLPTVNITAPGGEFGSIPVGAPYFGHDQDDMNICTLPVLYLDILV